MRGLPGSLASPLLGCPSVWCLCGLDEFLHVRAVIDPLFTQFPPCCRGDRVVAAPRDFIAVAFHPSHLTGCLCVCAFAGPIPLLKTVFAFGFGFASHAPFIQPSRACGMVHGVAPSGLVLVLGVLLSAPLPFCLRRASGVRRVSVLPCGLERVPLLLAWAVELGSFPAPLVSRFLREAHSQIGSQSVPLRSTFRLSGLVFVLGFGQIPLPHALFVRAVLRSLVGFFGARSLAPSLGLTLLAVRRCSPHQSFRRCWCLVDLLSCCTARCTPPRSAPPGSKWLWRLCCSPPAVRSGFLQLGVL